ncbi:Spo0E family sporulation regulatory protein-aspartic acid phosphatase [Priestia megaterium]|uniref:aspartyl-phosphate phosphatase Spo0E family protein n=1 Tax=Priestia megaterium TaxID=1404 RepID=UPI000BF99142|nr:aspartyl-phosphate phosphatase Spo0E family protein [Priestia megaterium]PEZ06842.1 Spo0E family sporulation regulatory protein-aspartic acid phosphatase [Priestia megaterium]WJD83871.1 aspartyl-phosphate phosphatase Spo0E family protein [Priestia megaterium]
MQRYRYNNALRKALLVDIEAARELMVQIGLEEGFTSKGTLAISRFVDQLLNQLEKVTATE